jgi:hypothetical protein
MSPAGALARTDTFSREERESYMHRTGLIAAIIVLWSWGIFSATGAAAEPELPIKDLIRRVQQELISSQATRESSGQQPLFQIDKLRIEINFVVTKTTNAKGELDFKTGYSRRR